jgi:hypothetical protein
MSDPSPSPSPSPRPSQIRERCPLCDRDGKINVLELDFGLENASGILGPVVCREKHGTFWYIDERGLPMVANAHCPGFGKKQPSLPVSVQDSFP